MAITDLHAPLQTRRHPKSEALKAFGANIFLMTKATELSIGFLCKTSSQAEFRLKIKTAD
jgi:hypothetical protein